MLIAINFASNTLLFNEKEELWSRDVKESNSRSKGCGFESTLKTSVVR